MDEVAEEFDQLFLGSIGKSSESKTEIIRSFPVTTESFHKRYTRIDCKLDTGAATNVLPICEYKTLFPAKHVLRKPTAKLIAYGGTEIPNHGSCTLHIRHKGKRYPVDFDVTESGSIMLGLKSCRDLDLIRLNCEVKPQKFETHASDARVPLTKEKIIEEFKDVSLE